ncbi:MAG: DUF1016 N-terminal domain-containing protein, partial [Spirochaetaceae bacterium]|nr:DUF1016 N-terminal domain-containing protein [Spirochaetaceae bacterium]
IKGHSAAIQEVNESIIDTNWDIGRYIVEFEQNGSPHAKYGVSLLDNLSKDLSLLHGRGFSRSNLNYMRLFYLFFPICETYLTNCHGPITANWLKESGLFLRLAASKDRDKVLKLARKGQIVEKPEEVVKDVYVFNS